MTKHLTTVLLTAALGACGGGSTSSDDNGGKNDELYDGGVGDGGGGGDAGSSKAQCEKEVKTAILAEGFRESESQPFEFGDSQVLYGGESAFATAIVARMKLKVGEEFVFIDYLGVAATDDESPGCPIKHAKRISISSGAQPLADEILAAKLPEPDCLATLEKAVVDIASQDAEGVSVIGKDALYGDPGLLSRFPQQSAIVFHLEDEVEKSDYLVVYENATCKTKFTYVVASGNIPRLPR